MNTSGGEDGRIDIRSGDWVDRYVPGPWQPYMRLARLDRPIGTWLLLLPSLWSIALAWAARPEATAGGLVGGQDWLLPILFIIGAIAMRGAGCTINDLWDRDLDAKVARTRTRPIANGDLSVKQALVFLVLELAIGAAVLFSLNPFAIVLGAASLIPVILYPLAKRVTYWPQAVLGLTFNWGALLGWAAATGGLAWPPVLLYAGGFFWTLAYDTIYAHQDKDDDALIGVKSSALRLGDRTRPFLFAFFGIALVLWSQAGAVAELHVVYYAGLLATALHFAWQAGTVDFNAPRDCLTKFKSNRDAGLLLLAGLVLAQVVGQLLS